MQRLVEPELMLEDDQACAYATADFDRAHSRYLELFQLLYPKLPATGHALDIGCGPLDVTLRFARALPGWKFDGIDGSAAMLRYGRKALRRYPTVAKRIRLIHGVIPAAKLPKKSYDLILCSSLLHHLHNPGNLWQTIRRHSQPGTIIFVADLCRPRSRAAAERIMEKYSGNEPAILRRDFFNSLLAAFTIAEVRQQLRNARLNFLGARRISDRHLLITGIVPGKPPRHPGIVPRHSNNNATPSRHNTCSTDNTATSSIRYISSI